MDRPPLATSTITIGRQMSTRLRRRLSRVLSAAGITLAIVALCLMVLGLYLYELSSTLPDLDVEDHVLTSNNSIVYAADGTVLAEWHGDEDRTIVPFDQMPKDLRNAVVAIEDRRFYEHNGVDVQSVVRAMRINSEAGEIRQGGSTITQQLVKILFTDGERTLTRKIREAMLAFELETRADKDQVLRTYLNTVYFGNGSYGVESAARRYFGTDAKSLTLSQSALLAAVIRSPSRYDPVAQPEAARARRDLVLKEMRKQGYITREREQTAAAEEIVLARPKEVPQFAPYFVEFVKRELVKELGAERVYGGGLRVYTTLEPPVQRAAENAARALSEPKDPSVAIAALRHDDGSIVAMVGGRDFATNQFNLASQGRRQPGSAFKPFVLVAALEKGVKPSEVFSAAPYSVPVKDEVWHVQNYENARTDESMSLHAATNWSVNAVYARLIMRVGPEKVVDVAKRMGIQSPLDPDPAIALGGLKHGVSPLEMASAYGTIANGGFRVAPTGIRHVIDDDGKSVYEPSRDREPAIGKQAATKAALMLHDVVEEGTGARARTGRWVAGKTGTTQSYRDAWFVGWSEGISSAVWVGYPEAQVDMTDVHGIRVTGGSFPAQIWGRFMRETARVQSKAVTPSDGTVGQGDQVKVVICEKSMMLANSRCTPTVEIWLPPNLVRRGVCTIH